MSPCELTEAVRNFSYLQKRESYPYQAVALFFAILSIWDRLGRPEVFKLFRGEIVNLSGLSPSRVGQWRDMLAEVGVIGYRNNGRQGGQYSLNPLLDRPLPDWDSEASQEGSNDRDSKIPDLINSLHPAWENMIWNSVQLHALKEVIRGFDGYPWDSVREYIKGIEPQYLPRRDNFVADQGRALMIRAEETKMTAFSGDTLSQITGGDVTKPGENSIADRLLIDVTKKKRTLDEAKTKWKNSNGYSNPKTQKVERGVPGENVAGYAGGGRC